jgi:hypothetical protein
VYRADCFVAAQRTWFAGGSFGVAAVDRPLAVGETGKQVDGACLSGGGSKNENGADLFIGHQPRRDEK